VNPRVGAGCNKPARRGRRKPPRWEETTRAEHVRRRQRLAEGRTTAVATSQRRPGVDSRGRDDGGAFFGRTLKELLGRRAGRYEMRLRERRSSDGRAVTPTPRWRHRREDHGARARTTVRAPPAGEAKKGTERHRERPTTRNSLWKRHHRPCAMVDAPRFDDDGNAGRLAGNAIRRRPAHRTARKLQEGPSVA